MWTVEDTGLQGDVIWISSFQITLSELGGGI